MRARPGSSRRLLLVCLALLAPAASGCATMRFRAPDRDLRPCTDGYATTDDGWVLGVRRYRPEHPDPGKLPVVLCHGLGLNGTFWTITPDHLPGQLAARGYEVFVVDLRGSGSSHRVGRIGRVNQLLRQTPFLELGEGKWTVDDLIYHDVPAILDHVERQTGRHRVNWIGHSLGGMLMVAYLEVSPHPERIANFVGMGTAVGLADEPTTKLLRGQMLRANRALRAMLRLVSTGRIARPMMYGRPPGLDSIDGFYYTAENVDDRTIDRFYGYTLENPGRGALKQLDPYLAIGRMLSADRRVDYVELMPRVRTPTLLVAGDGDVMADIPSTLLTFDGLGSPDKTLLRYGLKEGHRHDYGHCDLVWSRYAPQEIFPDLASWLDRHQPGPPPSLQSPSPQSLPFTPPHAIPQALRRVTLPAPQSPPTR